MTVNVYIPRGDQLGIAATSGIVSVGLDRKYEEDRSVFIVVDCEGNVYRADNIKNWADRVYHAWDRHTHRTPTIARRRVPVSALHHVGTFDPETGVITLDTDGRPVVDLAMSWLEIGRQSSLSDELRVTHRRVA